MQICNINVYLKNMCLYFAGLQNTEERDVIDQSPFDLHKHSISKNIFPKSFKMNLTMPYSVEKIVLYYIFPDCIAENRTVEGQATYFITLATCEYTLHAVSHNQTIHKTLSLQI